MNFSGVYQREQRNPSQMYRPIHSSVASYWTEAYQKSEMKHDFSDGLFLNNIHLIPDPLKKNLADTLFNNSSPKSPEKAFQQDQKMAFKEQRVPLKMESSAGNASRPNQGTTLGGISNFISGVINVFSSVMFRSRSPVNYHDCCDDVRQGSPRIWQPAKTDVQDKNGQADDRKSCDGLPNPNENSDMNFDKATVTSCENKLNQVLNLLTPKQRSSPVWVRKRPKKVFVEPGSVEDSFEDAFSPEDFVNLPNNSYIEYYSPGQYHCEELYETASQKTKLNMAPVEENTDIVKDVSSKSDLEFKKDDSPKEQDDVQQNELEKDNVKLENDNMLLEKELMQKDNLNLEVNNIQLDKTDVKVESDQLDNEKTVKDERDAENLSIKNELVSSCEDKLARLKAMLQEKRMKCYKKREVPEDSPSSPPKTIPAEKKPADKHYKNSKRRCGKRSKSKLKCRIEDDLVFANEINLGTPPSVENSPMQHTVNFGDYFDEVSGRFRSASVGSEDSFQIVFNDFPKTRVRTVSDCDSEDSFIIFDDSQDNCYMSNDVFCDSDYSDSESGMSDSGCGMTTCKLAHTLTRTFSNLADDSLYVESEDEVDFAKVVPVSAVVEEEQKNGLLLDDKKKLLRKCQPSKKVHFSADPPKVHVLRVWAFAARQARAGHWERFAVDRERFKRRINDVDMAVAWVLKPQHRRRIMFQRFMPWWNQLKRKELAEKKEREAEEKQKEEERKKEADRLETERPAGNLDTFINESKVDQVEETHSLDSTDENLNSETNELHRRRAVDNKIEFNNNKILICEEDNGKIPSKLMAQNITDAKKIQDLVHSNIEVITS